MLQDTLKRLTDNYDKEPSSTTYKLLKLVADELTEVKDTLQLTEDYRNITVAEGETLDNIGRNVNEFRLGRNDEDFRQAMLIKIASNTSGGDVERLNQILSVIVPGFQKITEGHKFEFPLNEESAAILVTVLAQEINNLPFLATNEITAAGIRTHWELIYQNNIKLISDFEALLAEAFESDIVLESEFSFLESSKVFPALGTFNAGEEVILP